MFSEKKSLLNVLLSKEKKKFYLVDYFSIKNLDFFF